jgi:hypothetical protein
VGRRWPDSSGSLLEFCGGFCERGNEPSSSTNYGQYLAYCSNCQLLKMDSSV